MSLKSVGAAIHICALLFLIHFADAQTGDGTGVLTIAEQMPEYPGGLDSLMKEVAAKVVYPAACIDSGIQGKVYVRFVVNEDGSISDLEAVKGPHPLLKAAAIEAVKNIGRFKPGMDKGKPVKVYYNLPVSFKIKLKVTMPEAPPLSDSSGQIPPKEHAGIYNNPEVPPHFPGDEAALLHFLNKNIQYPQMERDNGIDGKVLTSFVINEDGSISNIKVVKPVSPGLDAEAVRVIKLLPKFSPGMEHGKPVKTYFTLPTVFKLQGSGVEELHDVWDYYDGGESAFERLIKKNLQYPVDAKENKVEAQIMVYCKLDSSLKLHAVNIINGLDSEFNKEAIRLINLAPAFDSKVRSSKYIDEQELIRIDFYLDHYNTFFNKLNDDRRSEESLQKGIAYFNAKEYNKAIESFDGAIVLNSTSSNAFFNRALAKLKSGNLKGACDDFRRAYLLGELDAQKGIKQACK